MIKLLQYMISQRSEVFPVLLPYSVAEVRLFISVMVKKQMAYFASVLIFWLFPNVKKKKFMFTMVWKMHFCFCVTQKLQKNNHLA